MLLAARSLFDDRINQSASIRDLLASFIHSYLRDIKSPLADEATGDAPNSINRRTNQRMVTNPYHTRNVDAC
jgi:hypothetical protein